MKLIKVVCSTLLLLLFVSIVGIGSLMLFLDPNKLKPVIATLIKKETGYEAVIEGKFSWSLYPRIGVKVEHMALLAPKQTAPFLDMRQVIFITDLAQLIKGDQKLRGDVYISDMRLLNLHAQNTQVGLHWQNGTLTLSPIRADLYEGTLAGVAHGSRLAAIPRWDWNVEFKNIQLKPLLRDVNGVESKLLVAGTGQVSMQGTAQGTTKEQVLSSVNGTTTFGVTNGVLEGIDFNYLLETADAVIYKQPLKAPVNLFQTTFDSVVGTAVLKNGVAEINNFVLTSPAFVTTARGNINLPYQAINMGMMISPQKKAKGQWTIPIMVTGALSRPDVRLDMTELNVILARAQLEKVRSKVKQQIKEHISGKAGEYLQNLMGQ